MARRLDHRRDHHLGERLQRLHLREGQGETTSVDTPAGAEADRGRRGELEQPHYSHSAVSQSPILHLHRPRSRGPWSRARSRQRPIFNPSSKPIWNI